MMIAAPGDNQELFLRNYTEFCESGLAFDIPEDQVLWKYIKDFVQVHRHVPDAATLRDHFRLIMEDSVIQRLSTLEGLPSFDRGNFQVRLENRAKEHRSRQVAELLKDAATIHTTGIKVKRGREEVLLQGPTEAIRYILDKSHELVSPVIGQRLSGEITRDGVDFKDEYEQHKANPGGGFGQWSGLHQMDVAFNGAKKFELWIHAAFTGGMKCVAGDTEIWDLKTGSLRTVAEIYQSGDLPEVYSLNQTHCSFEKSPVFAMATSGIREILKVRTFSGRQIRVSGNHPFLTDSGWVDAEKLKFMDVVAVTLDFDSYFWEMVSSVTPDGYEMTYDLSVPGNENFVANGFITHNSTLMKNWAYNQAVHYLHSSIIFSLEEPYIKVRRDIYSIHSSHMKFQDIRYKLGLQKNPTATVGLPRTHIRDGTLSEWHPNAELFLNEYVIPDLNGTKVVDGIDPNTGEEWVHPSKYGKIQVEVADPDKSDFTVADLRHRAELIYSKDPFKMIFVDHAGLMSPRKWVSSTTDRLNEVIRDLKRLAMNFNRGQGVAVIALFQINREGHKSAQKIKEKTKTAKYELEHLSYANEAERSGDIITAGWTDDELRGLNRYQVMCLKSRDQQPFETFMARVEGPCMRLLTCPVTEQYPTQNEQIGADIDGLADQL
jgi:replicative DNA helicase